MADELLSKLKKATEGLLYPSEYDSPLEPFAWEKGENTEPVIRRLAGQSFESYCEIVSADQFFEEVKVVEGFPELYQTLKGALTELNVYRFGGTDISIYVVGRAEGGRLAGFKTLSVET
ncbi:MAG: nuclease A inhibitor family protein [Desulfomonilaceae bacterium]